MKHSSAATIFALCLLSFSLAAYSQDRVQKPEAPPPPTDPSAQVPPQPGAPAGAQPGAQPGTDPAAAAEPQPVMDLDPNYVLGTDDSIMVHVWKEPTISGPLVIRPDGRVTLPLVGDLPAAGMTPMALAAEISDGLKKFINDPSVTVTVTATNSRKVFFIGEIAHPGAVLMTRDMTMLQAIAAAGGLTPYANKHKLYILRGPKGNQQKIPFDYTKALKQGNQQGVSLVAGDTIVVP
jgi:polysaccharide export outer membrane protein